jgi:hypothetical protein
MQLIDTEGLFLEIDIKLFNMLQDVTLLIKEFKEGMDKHNVSVALPLDRENRYLGEPMIDMMEKMSVFIDDYKQIKDTWGVTTPSLDLDDEK